MCQVSNIAEDKMQH